MMLPLFCSLPKCLLCPATGTKTAKTKKGKLTAAIGEYTSDISVGDSKIEELSASISQNEAELNEAQGIRDKEHADFLQALRDDSDAISLLGAIPPMGPLMAPMPMGPMRQRAARCPKTCTKKPRPI